MKKELKLYRLSVPSHHLPDPALGFAADPHLYDSVEHAVRGWLMEHVHPNQIPQAIADFTLYRPNFVVEEIFIDEEEIQEIIPYEINEEYNASKDGIYVLKPTAKANHINVGQYHVGNGAVTKHSAKFDLMDLGHLKVHYTIQIPL